MSWIDHFGLLAPIYDRVIREKPPDQLIHHLKLPSTGVLLDAGGGTGRVSHSMAGLVDQLLVADLSLKMLSQAKKMRGLRTICSASESMPFPTGFFACILMVDALHHVINQQRTADELWRILKPGGRLVIEEPNIGTAGVKLIAIMEKLALMRSHFLSPAQIGELFNAHQAQASIQVHIDGAYGWVIVEKRDDGS
jgi:ubiquinone/menaquinone biosynthesis C-methylase UbiE